MRKIILIVGFMITASFASAQIADIYISVDFPSTRMEQEAERVIISTLHEIEDTLQSQGSYFPGVSFTNNLLLSDTGIMIKYYVYEDLGVETWAVSGFPTDSTPMSSKEPIMGVSTKALGEVSRSDMVRSLTIYFAQNYLLQ